jgi:hypothetical protein
MQTWEKNHITRSHELGACFYYIFEERKEGEAMLHG